MASITPTENDIFTTLRSFLIGALPSNVEVVQAQQNDVPEPQSADFVLMTPLRHDRLATNTDDYADVSFTASVAGNTLTVTEIEYGEISVGATLFGEFVPDGVTISAFGTGEGGVGTYAISGAPLTIASEAMACGATSKLQPVMFTVQLDVHGPSSADNSGIITTLFRDEYGYDAMFALNKNITPLYADDAKQTPFINDQNNYENRWVIEAVMQVNRTVIIPQQFADTAVVGLINVEATYPV